MLKDCTPGPWMLLEVLGEKFIAANVVPDHPYHGHTRFSDIAGDENYPRKDADLALISAAFEMAELLLQSRENIGGDWRERRDAVLKKAKLL